MRISEMQTPAFLVDEAVVEGNAAEMLERSKAWGAELRPHVKTHKLPSIAEIQLGGRKGPITVSTLPEAEYFAEHGFEDITWAVPLDPHKARRAADLSSRLDRLILLIDNQESLRALLDVASESTRLGAMIKIDCGYHRAGLDPADEKALFSLASSISRHPHVELEGLLTHGGHSYHADTLDRIRAIAREEVDAVRRAAECLTGRGIEIPTVSVGSTPTAVIGDLSGTDEIRPGNYIYFDAFQHGLGVCQLDQIAVSVLSTVISAYPERGKLLVDAGAIALSKDSGIHGRGYGIVCDEDLNPVEGLVLENLSQEHGEITGDEGRLAQLRAGDRIRIIPNHSCLTAAQFSRHWIVRGDEVTSSGVPAREW